MKKPCHWKLIAALIMVALSGAVYYLHYLIFHDAHHIFIYLVGDVAFVFLEVLLVSIIIHQVLNEWEKKSHLKKLNMVVEVFFSECGKPLLADLAAYDQNLARMRPHLTCSETECAFEFKAAARALRDYRPDIDLTTLNLVRLEHVLRDRRPFLVNLLQNPTLLEHESFTETLMAVFHLTEELAARDLDHLSPEDLAHTKGDIERAYMRLMAQWISYMDYIQQHYPYFFVFAARTNPFFASQKK